MSDYPLDRVLETLKYAATKIENFRDFVIAKPPDGLHEYPDFELHNVQELISSLNESTDILLNFEEWESSGVRPIEINPKLAARIIRAIDTILHNKAHQEKTGAILVALNALESFQSVLKNVSDKDTAWLKRGKKAAKVDKDPLSH